MKEARKTKRCMKNNYVCNICGFRKLTKNVIKGIIQGVKSKSKEIFHGRRKAI